MRHLILVSKALEEARKQLELDLSRKTHVSEPAAGPDYDDTFAFGLKGVLPRKKGAFRYSYGRLMNPTSWRGDNIVCNRCGHEYDPASVGEVAMGAVSCPKCRQRAVVDRGR